MDIGSRVRTARKAKGLTQEELARRAGVNLNVVGLLERGKTLDPHVSNLRNIAHALDMQTGELLGEPALPHRTGGIKRTREER